MNLEHEWERSLPEDVKRRLWREVRREHRAARRDAYSAGKRMRRVQEADLVDGELPARRAWTQED